MKNLTKKFKSNVEAHWYFDWLRRGNYFRCEKLSPFAFLDGINTICRLIAQKFTKRKYDRN